jgi:HD superfamily phosphohydrolase
MEDSEASLDTLEQSVHEWINPPKNQVMTHDPVHDSFYLPKTIWKIIDKPEYQRLRNIKQTGNTCYVYVGAEHTRFTHCIGVSHLCLEFGKTMQQDNPSMLTDRQVLLLGVAGLVHDIGHCACSHLYDNYVVPIFEPGSDFCHEHASYEIFAMMCEKYPDLSEIFNDNDVSTVGKLIFGSKKATPEKYTRITWSEWDETPPFYYEVLSNKRTGIDVDKFDYLKRDSHYTGVKTTFEPTRLINFYYIDKVTGVDGKTRFYLEYQPKAGEIIEVMWQSRDDLHRRVYQHRVVKCVDLMMTEVITLCGEQYIPGTETYLCDAHHDMEAYCKITDSMVRQIATNVPEAQNIINRIDNRSLWKTVAVVESDETLNFDFTDLNAIVSVAKLRGTKIYYVYYKGNLQKLDTTFYRELIQSAHGASITMRNK